MFECFFSNRYKGRSDLFEGLSIWNKEKYRQLQGSFPVIFLSFANIKAKKYEIMKNKIAEVIVQLYEQNRFLLDSGVLSENEKEYYKSIKVGMEDGIAEGAVHFTAGFMQRYYDKDVIIILDEYDTPMQELMSFAGQKTMLSGYWNEAVEFFRGFFNGWFGGEGESVYNDFIKALLLNDVDAMNDFMNEIALVSFSSFDTAKSASLKDAPERFYHGFVLGLMVELDGRFKITSNRESGFGRYDIMLVPKDREKDCAYIIEFKVHKPMKEKDLAETVANALNQIEEKQYEAKLVADGFVSGNIRKYGLAFKGKECLIG